TAESMCNRLMSQAYTEYRYGAFEFLYHFKRHPCPLRCARPRGQQYKIRLHHLYFIEPDLIISSDCNVFTALSKKLDDIVGKGVIVIDHIYHIIFLLRILRTEIFP